VYNVTLYVVEIGRPSSGGVPIEQLTWLSKQLQPDIEEGKHVIISGDFDTLPGNITPIFQQVSIKYLPGISEKFPFYAQPGRYSQDQMYYGNMTSISNIESRCIAFLNEDLYLLLQTITNHWNIECGEFYVGS
jgi:hypothetical protein